MADLFDGMRVELAEQLATPDSPVRGLRYVQVNDNYMIPDYKAIPRELTEQTLWQHPRHIGYDVPATFRAAAHSLAHPDCVLTGFGALAVYGLPHFADGCDTVLLNPHGKRRQQAESKRPAIVRGDLDPWDCWTLRMRKAPIRVASPPVAVTQALKAIRKGESCWSTTGNGEFDPHFIRAVQLVDAARRFVGVDVAQVLAAGQGTINLTWLATVLAHSSARADSPKETEMRLLTAGIARRHGVTMREQVAVTDGERIITRFDLALMEPQIGLMYDGAHHWENRQRQKDASINLEVTRLGWTPFRFASVSLESLPTMLDQLLSAKGW